MTTILTEADKFFLGSCNFTYGVSTLDVMPEESLPEFAFVGRSNVGKSSLMNALTGRKKLAHVSSMPGRTQQLNFFNLQDRCFLVDVPGYGYAKAAKFKIAAWQEVLFTYLAERRSLQRVFVLIDARHGVTKRDHEMLDQLDDAGRIYQLVFTKLDEVKKSEQAAIIPAAQEEIRKHPAAFPDMILTSAEQKTGITELRTLLMNLM